MNLTEIKNGSRILIDANIFLYASAGKSSQAAGLVTRCAQDLVEGVITTTVLGELCHRWMMEEAQSKGFGSGGSPAKKLAKNKNLISQLSNYSRLTLALIHGNIDIVPVEADDFIAGLALQKQWNLMTNDSLLLAVGQRLGINDVATADSDFDAANGWFVYKPDDLPTVLTAP